MDGGADGMGVNESVLFSTPVQEEYKYCFVWLLVQLQYFLLAQVPYSTKGAEYNVIKKSEQQRTNSIFKFKLHTPPSQPGRTTDHNIITSSSSSHLQSTCECVIPYHLSIAIAPVGIECKCLYIFNLIGPDFEIAS